MPKNNLEIYKQRFDTWRHLDKLRWQYLQFLIAICSGLFWIWHNGRNDAVDWVIPVVGVILVAWSAGASRINFIILENDKALRDFGCRVGDGDVQAISKDGFTVIKIVPCFLLISGVTFFILGISKYSGEITKFADEMIFW